MSKTRPKLTYEAVEHSQRVILKALDKDLSANAREAVGAALRIAMHNLAEDVIDIWTRPSDGFGAIMIVSLPTNREKNVYRVVASTKPDFRLAMADREIPKGNFKVVHTYETTRIVMALDRIRAKLKKHKVVHRHDDWYEVDLPLLTFICRGIVAGVNRQHPRGKAKRGQTIVPKIV